MCIVFRKNTIQNVISTKSIQKSQKKKKKIDFHE